MSGSAMFEVKLGEEIVQAQFITASAINFDEKDLWLAVWGQTTDGREVRVHLGREALYHMSWELSKFAGVTDPSLLIYTDRHFMTRIDLLVEALRKSVQTSEVKTAAINLEATK